MNISSGWTVISHPILVAGASAADPPPSLVRCHSSCDISGSLPHHPAAISAGSEY